MSLSPLTSSARPSRASLPAIITAARTGALAHAWHLFNTAGYDLHEAEPSVLAVKGRLLKDQALQAQGDERTARLMAAAAAYAAADQLMPQPYTQINIATLNYLAGNRATAIEIARKLIAWLDGDHSIAETPYFLKATRAEALLLCGDTAAADAALADAITHCPDSWDDHASTLRQLRLILEATGSDIAWLDRHRPPRSLHYAGHMGVAATDSSALQEKISAILATERIGFGYGALAAGSDVVIAERLLACGAELHVVLPTTVETFVAQSVTPYGAEWLPRFNACLAAAATVRTATQIDGPYEPLATSLATDLAMGAAVLGARRLETAAVQLLVIDEGDGRFGTGLSTARDGARWAATHRSQHLVSWPRSSGVLASGKKTVAEGRPDRRLAAMLHLSFDGIDALDDGAFAHAIDTVILPFREQIRASGLQSGLTMPIGNALVVAFSTVDAAWHFARTVLNFPSLPLPVRIAGHYGLAYWLEEPSALTGHAITTLCALAGSALPGVLTASEAMATTLFATCDDAIHAELVGELADMPLFTLTKA